MAKLKDPVEFLVGLGLDINIKYGWAEGMVKGRRFRYFDDYETIQIGDGNFDRWANSVALEFQLFNKADQRAFERWMR